MPRLNRQSLGRPREPNFIPLALPLPLGGCGTRAVRGHLCRRYALMDGLHTQVSTHIHQGSSRHPLPPGMSRGLLSRSAAHTHTRLSQQAGRSGRRAFGSTTPPPSPCALCSGRNRSKQASASMGETKNLPHGFFLSENGPAVLSRQITSAEANHDPFPPFPRRTPMEATRGLRLE